MDSAPVRGAPFIFALREFGGALGDLGTLLPLMLGCIAVAGLAPTPVLLGFAVFYIATALHYRLPVPVQPMKAVAAVALTAGITPSGIAAAGVLIGLVLLLLGATGWIDRLARLVPRSVLAGLQLGLGLALSLVAIDLLATAPLLGGLTLAIVVALLWAPRLPAAPVGLAAALALAPLVDAPGIGVAASVPATLAIPPLPSAAELERAVTALALPQLSLTFTNAVLLTALVAGDYFGERAAHVTPTRLALTSGLANLLLTPFGAMPMCHGAGGIAAHHRFGARSGTAALALGLLLLAIAVLPHGVGLAALAALPAAGLGALLLVTAGELAVTRRLFDSRPSCWPVIAATAGVTLWADPFWGLLAGGGAEVLRVAAIRAMFRRSAGPD